MADTDCWGWEAASPAVVHCSVCHILQGICLKANQFDQDLALKRPPQLGIQRRKEEKEKQRHTCPFLTPPRSSRWPEKLNKSFLLIWKSCEDQNTTEKWVPWALLEELIDGCFYDELKGEISILPHKESSLMGSFLALSYWLVHNSYGE